MENKRQGKQCYSDLACWALWHHRQRLNTIVGKMLFQTKNKNKVQIQTKAKWKIKDKANNVTQILLVGRYGTIVAC